MVHCFALVRGKHDDLEDDATRLYDTKQQSILGSADISDIYFGRGLIGDDYPLDKEGKKVNLMGFEMQPNLRYTRLYRVDVPEGAEEEFLQAMGPYNQAYGSTDFLKHKLNSIISIVTGSFKLKPIPMSKNKRHFKTPAYRDHVVVFMIGKEGV